MLRDEISLGQRVILESSEVTLANGTAGRHGVVVGALVEVPEFDPNDSEHLHYDGDILKGAPRRLRRGRRSGSACTTRPALRPIGTGKKLEPSDFRVLWDLAIQHSQPHPRGPWCPRPYATRALKPRKADIFDFDAASRGGLAVDREEACSH
jgi:hypothetical protein